MPNIHERPWNPGGANDRGKLVSGRQPVMSMRESVAPTLAGAIKDACSTCLGKQRLNTPPEDRPSPEAAADVIGVTAHNQHVAPWWSKRGIFAMSDLAVDTSDRKEDGYSDSDPFENLADKPHVRPTCAFVVGKRGFESIPLTEEN
jgi:hypothetical protein